MPIKSSILSSHEEIGFLLVYLVLFNAARNWCFNNSERMVLPWWRETSIRWKKKYVGDIATQNHSRDEWALTTRIYD